MHPLFKIFRKPVALIWMKKTCMDKDELVQSQDLKTARSPCTRRALIEHMGVLEKEDYKMRFGVRNIKVFYSAILNGKFDSIDVGEDS